LVLEGRSKLADCIPRGDLHGVADSYFAAVDGHPEGCKVNFGVQSRLSTRLNTRR
jgi:hypothetical protein